VRFRLRWRRIVRLFGVLVGLAFVAVLVAWYVSPDVRYVVRAAVEEAGILWRRRPIARVVADPATPPVTRGKLALVVAARGFAADSLGLLAGESFTTYSTVARDTLVLVLSASRSDRLAEKRWTYPIVGSVPYKGFFSFDAALREARELEREGMDTYLRVADAFSTLGWFNDPLLSTVMDEDSVGLAATVIHELVHNTLFVPGHVDFNESFANFVGYRGAERFFQARGEARLAARAAARWRDQLRLGRFYQQLFERLEAIYAPGLAGPSVREQRQQVFRAAAAQLRGPTGRALETIDGARFAEQPINNAVIIARRLYLTNLETFDRLYAAHRRDLKAVIAEVQRRAAGAADPWAAMR
jgi:predicted aminopeptidase